MFKDYSKKSSAYYQIRDWLESFIPYTYSKENLGLERIRYLLKLLGNPQNKFKSIHVAGTSGKGSTAYYIAKLIESSQEIKVGLHVSPHLIDIRERLQINGELIAMARFIKLMGEVMKVVDKIRTEEPSLTPSYFEILAAASFKYFADQKVDWAVVEVGLGGRLDATNILTPAISVITNVGLDHTEILGESIEKIAFEKAGIIKVSVPVVTGVSGKALEVIKKVAKGKNAPLVKINTRLGVEPLKSDTKGYFIKYYDILRHSSQNFVLALVTVSALGFRPSEKTVRQVSRLGLVGRLEEIQPGVILDGAHNIDKIRYLIKAIKNHTNYSNNQSIILVAGFKIGKDWKKMVDILVESLPVEKIIATKFYAATDTGRFSAVEPKEIARYVKLVYRLQTTVRSNSQQAVFNAFQIAYSSSEAQAESRSTKCKFSTSSNNNLVLVTGSLYLVGEARTLWYLPKF